MRAQAARRRFVTIGKTLSAIVLALAIGSFGGFAARFTGLPMPFLLGAFLLTGVTTVAGFHLGPVKPHLPMPLRNVFVGIIGVMIGGSFHPGIFSTLSLIWLPVIGVVFFVLASLAGNYLLFRRVGGYDRPTAFFAAMPGGLIESITMGERAGADVHILTMQQFMRIALVITIVPFLFLIVTGDKVGSAAGVTINSGHMSASVLDWAIMALCVGLGQLGGRALRLPASILVGPLILSAAAHYLGLTEAGPPFWLVAVSQIFVGTGLGARFRGFQRSEFARVIGLGLTSVALMLALDAAMVLVIMHFTGLPFDVLLISFAPGGVTETALIALSLHANPVFVTTLHVFRIILTVLVSSVIFRSVQKGG